MEKGIARGLFRQVDVRVTAILIWNLFMGLFAMSTTGASSAAPTTDAAVDFILHRQENDPSRG